MSSEAESGSGLDSSPLENYAVPENVSIRVYLSAHGSAEDAPNMAKHIAEADIFAPEVLGWTSAQQKAFERISKGDLKQYQTMRQSIRQQSGAGSYTEAMIGALYSRRIPVIMFDVPDRHPIANKFREYTSLVGLSKALRADFDQTIEGLQYLYGDKAGPVTRQREEYMLDKLAEGLTITVREHPKLRESESVSALITLGGDHTYVYHGLKQDHPEPSKVNCEFGHEPVVYGHHVRCLRAGQFGVEITRDMAARAYAELIANAVVRKENLKLGAAHEDARSQLLIRAVGSLSLDDIVSLHDTFRHTLYSGKGYDMQNAVIDRLVRDLTSE